MHANSMDLLWRFSSIATVAEWVCHQRLPNILRFPAFSIMTCVPSSIVVDNSEATWEASALASITMRTPELGGIFNRHKASMNATAFDFASSSDESGAMHICKVQSEPRRDISVSI
jgi:hypothetical protein